MAGIERITREARLYALKELARRAGVAREHFRTWKIEFGDEEIRVYPQPPGAQCIRFKSAPLAFGKQVRPPEMRGARAAWMRLPDEPARTLVPNFVVPFAHQNGKADRPLFMPVTPETVECSLDVLASTLLTLTRYEEVASSSRDAHGRFTASASMALNEGYLERPIVDEYGLALAQALAYLLPGWQPAQRRLRVKLSHDIDDVGGFFSPSLGFGTASGRSLWMMLPFNGRYAVQWVTRRCDASGSLRHVWGCLTGKVPSCLDLVRHLIAMSREHNLDSAVYWKASPVGPYDSGYDPRQSKVRRVIGELRGQGVESGVHPGYETFMAPEKLASEIETLRDALGEQTLGGRQHYLRWCPETWIHWEQCGLAYDSTLTYEDHYGFRAGTCIPYRPWLLAQNREASLIEIPLTIMDGTLTEMHLSEEQSLTAVKDCLQRCKLVGGVFTFLCHNSTLLQPGYLEFYDRVLDLLGGYDKFDWKTPAPEVW